jgi:hypothetical protein
MTHKKITPEEFVEIWQTSHTVAEVVKRSGQGPNTVSSRAAVFRKKGVPLKRFRRADEPLDYGRLKYLALKFLKKFQAGI